MRAALLIPIVLLTFVVLNIFPSQDIEIVTEGRSSLANRDIEKARDSAIEDALRRAVEQGVGTFISSESITEKYRLIYDKILSNSFGYIREYKILTEEKDGGFYIVKIRAVVSSASIENDLQAIGLLLERKNLPRLMILIQESLYPNSDGENYLAQQSQAEVSVVSAFLEKSFFVIDSATLNSSREREQAIRALQGDSKAASLLGLMHEADLVVLGTAASSARGKVANSNFISVGTTLTLKVIRTDTAEILAVKTWNSSGAGLDVLAASNNSVKRVSENVCDELISDVLNKWAAETGGTHIIQIQVTQVINFSDLDHLEKTLLNRIPGIQELYRRSYERGIAMLDARVKGEADTIASAIQKFIFGRYKVVVSGFSKNVIKLKLVYE